MSRSTIISVINAKGGIAKTTSTLNLAHALGTLGMDVLVVDFDPQGGLTGSAGINTGDLELQMGDVILSGTPIEHIIRNAPHCKFDVAPANINLSVAEVALIDHAEPGWTIEDQRKYRESRLVKALANVRNAYDVILIDNQPSLGILAVNSMSVADYILIPVATEFMSLMGLNNVLKLIEIMTTNRNAQAKILGVLPTLADTRTNHTKDMLKELYKICRLRKIPFYKEFIPRSVRVQEAAIVGQSVLDYAPTSDVARAYLNVAKLIHTEVMARVAKTS